MDALLAAMLTFRLKPSGSLTATCVASPANAVASRMTPSPRVRTPTICADYEPTGSSRRSRIPTATKSPTMAHTAAFLCRVHDRLLPTGLAILADTDRLRPLRTDTAAYQAAFDKLTASCGIAASADIETYLIRI